jgi:hypothetical protein
MIIVHVRTAWCSSLNLEIQELRRRREIYREAQFEASTTRLMDDACNERLITRTGLATLRRLTTIHTVYCLKLATAYETSRYLHTQRHARSTIFTVDHSLPILHQIVIKILDKNNYGYSTNICAVDSCNEPPAPRAPRRHGIAVNDWIQGHLTWNSDPPRHKVAPKTENRVRGSTQQNRRCGCKRDTEPCGTEGRARAS